MGSDQLSISITVCLLLANHKVTLYTDNSNYAFENIKTLLTEIQPKSQMLSLLENLEVVTRLTKDLHFPLAIVICKESLELKQSQIQEIEKKLPNKTVIAINTESIALSKIQQNSIYPERIIGLNWTEPAHTTFFLEIISNEQNSKALVSKICLLAKDLWNKDPYILNKDLGIRSRMLCAMIREAFYLIENGYVTIEDIDRACRNDAGHYFPFAGNCRYMDLMGTYIYGVVMQDLNPELSKDIHIPDFFINIIKEGGKGMENDKGFYNYKEGDISRKKQLFRKFSYEIKEIIEKYPFNYLKESKASKKSLSKS